MKSLYIGNLPFTATEDELRTLFAAYGTVESIRLMMDRETGRPRGFGFVEMADSHADRAAQDLNGTLLGGRALRINPAEPRNNKPATRW
jgi:RNA recognition motif-containing protein